MPSPIVNASIQASLLAALSNILAQLLECYQLNRPLTLDATPISQFILFSLLNTPHNFLWQEYLEATFPGYTVEPVLQPPSKSDRDKAVDGHKTEIVPKRRLNKRNTAVKLFLDQTVGMLVNTVLFIAGMGALKGGGSGEIVAALRRDTIPLLLAGYKLWPLVSLLSFTVVPVRQRVVFGGVVGVAWGVFLSLFSQGL